MADSPAVTPSLAQLGRSAINTVSFVPDPKKAPSQKITVDWYT